MPTGLSPGIGASRGSNWITSGFAIRSPRDWAGPFRTGEIRHILHAFTDNTIALRIGGRTIDAKKPPCSDADHLKLAARPTKLACRHSSAEASGSIECALRCTNHLAPGTSDRRLTATVQPI